jgi:mannose-6-phosphate isomerase-like protein (cupin superfamily)
MIPIIKLEAKIKEIGGKPWSPVEVARINDQVVRMALLEGEYHITLNEGQMAVVPKGVEHCPKSLQPSYVLMFEPFVLKSKGD